MASPSPMPRPVRAPLTNWAGNVEFGAARYHEPTSVDALRELVAGAERVRALGTRHSFSPIADTTGDLVSVARLPRLVEVDPVARVARVGAGVRYGELFTELQAHGLALPNTGSLPHISVAGACATGTHGSGRRNPVLGRSVRALTMVRADGELVTVDGAGLDGYLLSLGRLGIVTELVLDVRPTFDVAQSVVVDVPDASLAEHLPAILGAAYSVSVFTALEPDRNQVWVKRVVGAVTDAGPADAAPRDLWGGRPADGPRHPIDGIDPASATQQLGVPGPWHERLPHFRLEFQPSAGEELQSEYLLPMESAGPAWAAVLALRAAIREPLLTIEIRSVAADPFWLSPTGGRDCVAIHFTWERDPGRVLPVLEQVERALEPYDARPHWGKVFTTPAATLAARYPRLPDFRDLVGRDDPAGTFGNQLVDGWLGLS